MAQSWGVISGALNPIRAAAAMAAVDEYLVRKENGLVLLFTPPFDKTLPDPGYIKGYPPGSERTAANIHTAQSGR